MSALAHFADSSRNFPNVREVPGRDERHCNKNTTRSPRRSAWRSRPCFSTTAGDKVFSPLPVALVERRRRAQPGTPDTLGARKAKVLHQVNQALAQSKIRRRPVDRSYARHLDLRQDRCRSFGRPHRRRLLRLCCKRPCRSHASEQADELASFHSITSLAKMYSCGGIVRPRASAVLRLITKLNRVGCSMGR